MLTFNLTISREWGAVDILYYLNTGVARSSEEHGQGTVRDPQQMLFLGYILVGGPLDPRGP